MDGRGVLVYVHGASDRAAQVADHVARIEAQLRGHQMPLDVLASDWGGAAGAKLDRIDLAIPAAPAPDRRLAASGVPPDEADRPIGLLGDGPFSGLARLAVEAAGESASPEAAIERLRDAPPVRDADRLLGLTETDPPLHDAATAVGRSPEYALARAAPVAETDLVAATARAVAVTAATSQAPPTQPLDLASLFEMRIAELVLAAAAATLLAGYIGVDVGPGLKRWATDALMPHRSRLTRDVSLGVADVLLFQRDGGAIRGSVASTLERALATGRPVVALGNSLGSIILIDVLAGPAAPRPDLLVTVGSPAPLLQTFGGLGPDLTAPFQPWLNVYDRRDYLAFVAQPVWPGQPGISDVAVDMGVGFPDSHGATYLSEPAVYAAIRDHPALRGPDPA